MAQVGHSTADMAGRFTGADVGLCEILKMPTEKLVGLQTVAVSGPESRDATLALMHKIQRDGKPFTIVKRGLRGDGSGIWIQNEVSLIHIAGSEPQFIATTRQLVPSHDPGRMQDFLHIAKLLYRSRRLRMRLFDLELFTDPAWDAVLAAYVAECEGQELRASAIWRDIGLIPALGARWLKVLELHDIIECEPCGKGYPADCAVRLTMNGQMRLERHLGELMAWQDGRLNELADAWAGRSMDLY